MNKRIQERREGKFVSSSSTRIVCERTYFARNKSLIIHNLLSLSLKLLQHVFGTPANSVKGCLELSELVFNAPSRHYRDEAQDFRTNKNDNSTTQVSMDGSVYHSRPPRTTEPEYSRGIIIRRRSL